MGSVGVEWVGAAVEVGLALVARSKNCITRIAPDGVDSLLDILAGLPQI